MHVQNGDGGAVGGGHGGFGNTEDADRGASGPGGSAQGEVRRAGGGLENQLHGRCGVRRLRVVDPLY